MDATNCPIISFSRSRKGAWIEISSSRKVLPRLRVAPVRERGLKFGSAAGAFTGGIVAPVRERGLKYRSFFRQPELDESLP